jgi:hypothetical protein
MHRQEMILPCFKKRKVLVPCPQMEVAICWNHCSWKLMGPLFQILSDSPSERKKGASMAVAPVIAMFAPFLKSAVVDLDGGRNGSPNLLPANTH